MLEIILGFALGAMTFTETGRELGDKFATMAMSQMKKIGEQSNDNK